MIRYCSSRLDFQPVFATLVADMVYNFIKRNHYD